MVWHGFLAKAVPTVVTGAVGVAAYEALRKMVVKAPLRAATVSVAARGHTLST
ncbi:irpA [Mycobacterium tuberculosis]|nr:irpA [Mycobacterium tuberculosis]